MGEQGTQPRSLIIEDFINKETINLDLGGAGEDLPEMKKAIAFLKKIKKLQGNIIVHYILIELDSPATIKDVKIVKMLNILTEYAKYLLIE